MRAHARQDNCPSSHFSDKPGAPDARGRPDSFAAYNSYRVTPDSDTKCPDVDSQKSKPRTWIAIKPTKWFKREHFYSSDIQRYILEKHARKPRTIEMYEANNKLESSWKKFECETKPHFYTPDASLRNLLS